MLGSNLGRGYGSTTLSAPTSYDSGGTADLAIGVPYETVYIPESANYAGAIHVLFGTGGGLTGDDNQFWYQGYNGVQGSPGGVDLFGLSLAARPFSVDFLYLPMVVR